MKKYLLVCLLLMLSVATFAKDTKAGKRTPASVLSIDMSGTYISTKYDPAEVQLKGEGFGFSLGSRYDLLDKQGNIDKSRTGKLKGTIVCQNDNECTVYFDK